MSTLSLAEERATSALQRLEQVLRGGTRGDAAEDQATLARDCELLRQECDSLRRELAAAQESRHRVSGLVDQVEDRLDGAIRRLGDLAGG
jgi:hypothetical protein